MKPMAKLHIFFIFIYRPCSNPFMRHQPVSENRVNTPCVSTCLIAPNCATTRLYRHLRKVTKMPIGSDMPHYAVFLSCIVMQASGRQTVLRFDVIWEVLWCPRQDYQTSFLPVMGAAVHVILNAWREGKPVSDCLQIKVAIEIHPIPTVPRPCSSAKCLRNPATDNHLFNCPEMLTRHFGKSS